MAYEKSQRLNEWVAMLDGLYGASQNYSKTQYEIHSHLTEVCGIFAKHQFKKRDPSQAITFLPKMFAWAVGLMKKINPSSNLEEIILRKFPGVCPYCGEKPCECWKGEKPTLDADRVLLHYRQSGPGIRRSIDDFQQLFREIYGTSWGSDAPDCLNKIFIRLTEELAEVAESVRFHHLYPENFENELADFFAWWFALVSSMPSAQGSGITLASDILWKAYPGICLHCRMLPCYCRPGPVRELMSRPLPGQAHRFDGLTSTLNQTAFLQDRGSIAAGHQSVPTPIACARIDLDSFKSINETYGHAAGDQALRHVATLFQRRLRERDKLYRAGGDEFAIMFFEFSKEEAYGLMNRVSSELHASLVRWVNAQGKVVEFPVTVSIGVAESATAPEISAALELADEAAMTSKAAGKARVTLATAPQAAAS